MLSGGFNPTSDSSMEIENLKHALNLAETRLKRFTEQNQDFKNEINLWKNKYDQMEQKWLSQIQLNSKSPSHKGNIELENTIEELKLEVAILKKENNKFHGQETLLNKLRTQKSELEAEIIKLHEKLASVPFAESDNHFMSEKIKRAADPTSPPRKSATEGMVNLSPKSKIFATFNDQEKLMENLKEELERRNQELKEIKEKNLVPDFSEGDTDKTKSKIRILERELMVQNTKNVQLNQQLLELEGLKSNLSDALEKLKKDNGLLWAEVVGKPNENSNILLISMNEHLEGLKKENNDLKNEMKNVMQAKEKEESLLKNEILILKEKVNELNVKIEFANKKSDQIETAHKVNEETLADLNKDNATLLNQINDYIEKINAYLREKEKYELELQATNLKINELNSQLDEKTQNIKTLNTEIEFLKINAMEHQSSESQKITEIKKKEGQRNQLLMDQINELNSTIGKQKALIHATTEEFKNLNDEKISLEKSLNEKVNNLQIKLEESEMTLDQQKIAFKTMIEENKIRIDEKNMNEVKLMESQSKLDLQNQELKVLIKEQNSKMSMMNNNLMKMTEEFQEKERFLIENINNLKRNAQELDFRLNENKLTSQEASSEKNELLKRIQKLKESEQTKTGEIDAFKLELSKYIQSEQASRKQIQELKNEINKYQENEQKYFSQLQKAAEMDTINLLKESNIQLSLNKSEKIKEDLENLKINYDHILIEKNELIKKIKILENENQKLKTNIVLFENNLEKPEEREDIKRGGYGGEGNFDQKEKLKKSFAGGNVHLQKKIEELDEKIKDLNDQLNMKNQEIAINSKQSISFKDDYFGESIEQIITTNQKLAMENEILTKKIEDYLKIKEEYEKLFNLNQKKAKEISILKKQIKSKESERNISSNLASENQSLKQALSEIELNLTERKNDELNDLKEKIMEEAQKIMQQQKQEADLEIFSLKKLLMKRSKLLIDNDRKTARFLERIGNCQPNLQTDIAAFFKQEFEETNESEIANDESPDYLKQTILELEAENANLFSALKEESQLRNFYETQISIPINISQVQERNSLTKYDIQTENEKLVKELSNVKILYGNLQIQLDNLRNLNTENIDYIQYLENTLANNSIHIERRDQHNFEMIKCQNIWLNQQNHLLHKLLKEENKNTELSILLKKTTENFKKALAELKIFTDLHQNFLLDIQEAFPESDEILRMVQGFENNFQKELLIRKNSLNVDLTGTSAELLALRLSLEKQTKKLYSQKKAVLSPSSENKSFFPFSPDQEFSHSHLFDKLKELEINNWSLEAEVLTLREEKMDNSQSLSLSEKNKSRSGEQILNLLRELENYRQRYAELVYEHEKLKQEKGSNLFDREQSIIESQQKIQELQKNIRISTEERTRMENLRNQVEILQEEKKKYENDYIIVNLEKNELTGRINEMQKLIEEMQKNFQNDKRLKEKRKEEEIENLKLEIKGQKGAIFQLVLFIQNIFDKINGNEKPNQNRIDQIPNQDNEENILKTERFQMIMNSLNQDFSKTVENIEFLRTNNLNLQKETEKLNKVIENHQNKAVCLPPQQSVTHAKEISDLKTKLKLFEEENKKLHANFNSINNQASIEEKYTKITNEQKILISQLKLENQELKITNKEIIEKLEISTKTNKYNEERILILKTLGYNQKKEISHLYSSFITRKNEAE